MANRMGCGPMAALMIFIFVVLIGGGNEAVGFYYTSCDRESENFIACLLGELAEEDEKPEEEGTVTAVGDYTHKGHTVTITMNVPLKGGSVTGSVSGTCEGSIKGTANASGQISNGTFSGVCSPFFVNLPAGGTFSGSVNKGGKTVSISFNGQCSGFSHAGSTTLVYK